ncbi:MAG: ATP-grasp domain-containing protein [Pirellulales bacterium]
MRIFLYEFITGGGLLADPDPFPASLLAEGLAMLTALAADLAAIPHVQVAVMRDHRVTQSRTADQRRGTRTPLAVTRDQSVAFADTTPAVHSHLVHDPGQEPEIFERLVCASDAAILIAPEFDGHLQMRAAQAEQVGIQLLSPGSHTIALCADKHRTARHLAAHDVPVPPGRLIEPGQPLPPDFTYPAVLKPVDGAGSLGVRRIESPDDWNQQSHRDRDRPHRLERFQPGLPASVAVLCGPGDPLPLPACRQRLSEEGQFRYLGGSLPLSDDLDRRARRLATRAVATLGDVRGYIGVDLVLGDVPDGAADVVIEINPRLTTSYVGLRAATDHNLAEAMLAAIAGRPPALSFPGLPVQFDADGTIHASFP